MNKRTVAFIFGGVGCEHSVSVTGALNLYPHVDREKFKPIPVLISKSGEWLTEKNYDEPTLDGFLKHAKEGKLMPTFPVRLGKRCGFMIDGDTVECSAAFPLLHGDGGEDGTVQGALISAGIRFVGCDTVAGAVAIDKGFTKAIAEKLGIPVVPWIYTADGDAVRFISLAERTLGYPLFVKAARLGSSVGAYTARCREELVRAYGLASRLGSMRVIGEKLIEAPRELECGFYSVKGKVIFTNIGEISAKDGFYDYDTKYVTGNARITDSADIDSFTKGRILSYAKLITEAIGCRGLSRIDFFLDKGGSIYFNEINTMPGMTGESLYPRLLEGCGISPRDMLTELLEDAVYAGNI